MIPAKKELSDSQRSALSIISSTKGGYRNDEFQRRGLGSYKNNPVLIELEGMGLVKISKNGACQVTTDGKNALTA